MGPNRLIADFDSRRGAIEAAVATGARIPLAEARLLTPVPWPNKVIAYPVNYHDHGREMAGYRADVQGSSSSRRRRSPGPEDAVELPALPGREVHHESELAIVIGKGGRDISREDWADHVFGYACLLDMVVQRPRGAGQQCN